MLTNGSQKWDLNVLDPCPQPCHCHKYNFLCQAGCKDHCFVGKSRIQNVMQSTFKKVPIFS